MNMTKAENALIAETIFPGLPYDIKKLKVRRGWKRVFRLAPSPTGEMHIGTLLIALINKLLTIKYKGIFILRIEDTDQSREKPGATDFIYSSLKKYGIKFNESPEIGGKAGPYVQSLRRTLYHCCAKKMLRDGTAYLDFQTPEETAKMRAKQEHRGIPLGTYGGFSVWRNADYNQVAQALKEERPYAIRFYNPNPHNTKKSRYSDSILGNIELAPYIWDEVILKTDGLPTYHAAHIWDDILMGVTDVFRGNDWRNSLPLHLMLYIALGHKAPRYGHIPTINKKIENTVTKLSKRTDREASLNAYEEWGIPRMAVLEYLMGIASSKFEDWRKVNPFKDIWEYPLNPSDLMKKNGPVIDFNKIYSISKVVISNFTGEKFLKDYFTWAKIQSPKFSSIISSNPQYSLKVFGIGKTGTNRRKDISNYRQVQYFLGNMYDEVFYKLPKGTKSSLENLSSVLEIGQLDTSVKESKMILKIYHDYVNNYGIPASSQEMMNIIKAIPNQLGMDIKLQSVVKVIRVSLYGRTESPDLFEIQTVLGKSRALARMKYTIKLI